MSIVYEYKGYIAPPFNEKSPRCLKVEESMNPSESKSFSPKYEFSKVEFVILLPQQLVNANIVWLKLEKVELFIFI